MTLILSIVSFWKVLANVLFTHVLQCQISADIFTNKWSFSSLLRSKPVLRLSIGASLCTQLVFFSPTEERVSDKLAQVLSILAIGFLASPTSSLPSSCFVRWAADLQLLIFIQFLCKVIDQLRSQDSTAFGKNISVATFFSIRHLCLHTLKTDQSLVASLTSRKYFFTAPIFCPVDDNTFLRDKKAVNGKEI